MEVDVLRHLARSRPVRTAPALLGLAVLGLGACTTVGEGTDAPATSEGVRLDGLTATLYQTRMDVAVRQVEVRLHNGTGSDVTLRSAQLRSSAYDAPMRYAKEGSVLAAGRVVDLPVALAAAVCDDVPPTHTVHLDYLLEDGREGAAELPATDDSGQVAALHAAECFEVEVADVAALTITDRPRLRDLGGVLVADLTVDVEPAGRARSLTIDRVASTTLLQQVDPRTGERLADGYAVDVAVSGSSTAPAHVTFTVVPGRCDAHAVAEDKQGTLFRLDVVLDGQEGQVTVASPPEVTNALYGFVREACAP